MSGRLLISCLLLCSGVALNAQVRLTGRVLSDTNAPLANAAVDVRPASGGPSAHALTDPTGAFELELQSPGDYVVTAELTGYYELKDKPVTIRAGDNELNLVLNPVREFSESVDVTAPSTSVELDRTTSEEHLTGAQMLDIPFPATHSLKNAMRILPGLVQDSAGGIHVNGGSENQVRYLINGFDISDPLSGKFDTRISIESVQSMEVLSGRFPAEYGKGSAGVVEVNTRTGDDKFRYSATNFVPGIDSQKGLHIGSWNPRFNFSGPIRRGRIWFSDSLATQYDKTVIEELPPGEDSSTSLRYTNMLHTQANVSPSNILSAGFLAAGWTAVRNGLSALDPPETTVDRRSRQWFGYIKDQVYFGRGALIEFGVSGNQTQVRQIPQGHDLYIETPEGRHGNFFINGVQRAERQQFLTNGFLPVLRFFGEHQVKAGIDFDRVHYSQNIRRTGFEWRRTDNTLVRRVLFAGNGQFGLSNFEAAAYVQDAWRVRKHVLVELGMRFDWDQILRNWNVSPRTGVAWSPFGLENTKVSAGYAITYDATSLILFTRPEDQYQVTTLYPPYGVPDVPVQQIFTVNGRRYRSPRFQNWSAAIDHRLGANVYLRVQALRRRGDHGLTYTQMPSASPYSEYFALANRRSDSYDSVEVTFRQNFRKEYSWMASYTRSRALSNVVIDLSSDNPAIVSSNAGRLPWDAPNRFLSWGYLPTFRKDWAVAFLLEYRSGFPFSYQNDAGEIVGDVNSHRYPTFFELDLHLEKRFRFRGQLWAIRGGFNNITNHRNPNVVNNNIDSPQFLSFYGGQSRALNFRIRWLGKLPR
jgi:hypothetical protein